MSEEDGANKGNTSVPIGKLGHYADHAHPEEVREELVDEGADEDTPQYRAKGWNDIAKQAGVGQKSKSCTIL